MKILGKKGTRHGGFIVEVEFYELDKLLGGGHIHDLDRLDTGATVEVGAMWDRLHALERAIKAAGADAPRNIRALADLLEDQLQPITPPQRALADLLEDQLRPITPPQPED